MMPGDLPSLLGDPNSAKLPPRAEGVPFTDGVALTPLAADDAPFIDGVPRTEGVPLLSDCDPPAADGVPGSL